MATRSRTTSSPVRADHDGRWRPDGEGPSCGYSFRGSVCEKEGSHYCEPRADRAVAFVESLCVHTKGRWARQAFVLAGWQEHDIVRPLFGEVVWSDEWACYVRRYRIARIVLGRKTGKGLDVDTPVLAERGWTTMGELKPGDRVHAPDGSLTDVEWVSDRHQLPCWRVAFADGAELVADQEHQWSVYDRRLKTDRVVTTPELAETVHYGKRGDRRYRVTVPSPLQRPEVPLPVDPYVLGCWLGDGSSSKAEITSADPEIIQAVESAGYEATYSYQRGDAATRGFLGLKANLSDLGVLGNKHVPDEYLAASEGQRLALLRGLMDTDGCADTRATKASVEFMSTTRTLAEGVRLLAQSLGWKATIKESRATLYGKDCGPKWRVTWSAYRDYSPFALSRKTDSLHDRPAHPTRSATNAVVSVEPVESRPTVCISVAHPSSQFLAGSSLTPTHNSELVAALVLLLLVGDDEEGAEVYGAARDTKQAGKVGDVVVRMRQLSPKLSARLEYNKNSRRVFDETTGSWFEVITADALGELGHNPHGAYIDEVLSQRDGSLYDALRTAMGARHQPLMLLVTTETNDPSGFGAGEIDEAERVQEDPTRAPHVFAYVRKMPKTDDELERLRGLFGDHPALPVSTDPWDEANWFWPCPSLAEFKSLQGMRDEALEARNDPSKENSFRQYQLNQRVSQATRFVPMDLWDRCVGEVAANPAWVDDKLDGMTAVGGLDLSAKFDLTAWCLLFESGWVRWRFWLPEDMIRQLDGPTGGWMTEWVRRRWVTATDGDVIDYDQVEREIAEDCERFRVRRIVYDKWSGEPVRQRIEDASGVEMVESSPTYERMTEPMKDLLARVRQRQISHGGHPVARWMADSLEAKSPADDPDRLRPVKPERDASGKRIDGMVALLHAIEGELAGEDKPSVYETRGLAVL